MSDTPALDFPCETNPFFIPGPTGRLEALSRCSDKEAQPVIAVICHPHPLYGGTMQNKVVHTLEKTFNKLGASTLRFNFRGVGNSEGKYDQGEGELDDLVAVVEWCQQRLPGHRLWLSGFSFGAYIAFKAAQSLLPEKLITVAPPVNIFDFSQHQAPAADWILLQGDADEIVDAQQVQVWAQQFPQVDLITMAGAGHFFHGRLNDLQSALNDRLVS